MQVFRFKINIINVSKFKQLYLFQSKELHNVSSRNWHFLIFQIPGADPTFIINVKKFDQLIWFCNLAYHFNDLQNKVIMWPLFSHRNCQIFVFSGIGIEKWNIFSSLRLNLICFWQLSHHMLSLSWEIKEAFKKSKKSDIVIIIRMDAIFIAIKKQK